MLSVEPMNAYSELSLKFPSIAPMIKTFAEEEYRRGWQDAVKAVFDQVALDFIHAVRGVPKSGGETIKELIRSFIKDNAGLRTSVIMQRVLAQRPACSRHTVYTTLKRLKQQGCIERRDGSWYWRSAVEGRAPDHEPADRKVASTDGHAEQDALLEAVIP